MGNIKKVLKEYSFTAICGAGLERLVEEELLGFGAQAVRVEKGCVFWQGELETGYLACLWSRFSSRIFLEIARFPALDEDAVYNNCLEIDWSNLFSPEDGFAISCTLSGTTKITHNHFTALRVKDAVVDFFRQRGQERPSVQKNRPDVQFHLHVQSEEAMLYLDMSGESLHRRGYRKKGGEAPLKETLAAAIVALSGWRERGGSVLDPMCGTGTLLIEAALMFGDSAPGLFRNYFGFLGWLDHDATLWRRLVDSAMAREERAGQKEWPPFVGYDCDERAVAAARKNIVAAGLSDRIHVEYGELATLLPPKTRGTLISNLPFGERLLEEDVVAQLYKGMGRIIRERCGDWWLALFLMKPEMTDYFSIPWQEKYRLFNGSLPCRLLVGKVSHPPEPEFLWTLPDGQGGDADFANRLRKNMKQRLKWAKRENISCFRLYDRDLPEYNLCIDIYSKWIHVQEFAAPKTVDAEIAAQRLKHALQALREVLGVRSDRIFVKTRQRQRGAAQYQKKDGKKKMHMVREGACSFLVNFTDYLDTGLFLDHRPIRERIFQESKGKKFLNLFGYTATASVMAAAGGATTTTTVDLSASYLLWGRMNLSFNGFGQTAHRTIQADCMDWLKNCSEYFDLIFIDPPTFSNTKKEKRVFDIQRDHLELLRLAMKRLEPGGTVLFSTNFRKFILEQKVMELGRVNDITPKTIPSDFRNDKVHKCWEITSR